MYLHDVAELEPGVDKGAGLVVRGGDSPAAAHHAAGARPCPHALGGDQRRGAPPPDGQVAACRPAQHPVTQRTSLETRCWCPSPLQVVLSQLFACNEHAITQPARRGKSCRCNQTTLRFARSPAV